MNKFYLFSDMELTSLEQAIFLFSKAEIRYCPDLLAEVRAEIQERDEFDCARHEEREAMGAAPSFGLPVGHQPICRNGAA